MRTVRPAAELETDQRYLIPVVQSSFKVLEAIAGGSGLTLAQVVEKTRIPKATAFRILTTLCSIGYLVRDDQRRYHVSPFLGNMTREAAFTATLKHLCSPHMSRLRDKYGETVNLGRLCDDQVSYVDVAPSDWATQFHETPGATVSLHATGLGKALLAFSRPGYAEQFVRGRKLQAFTRNTITSGKALLDALQEIRCMGYASDRGETSTAAACVAAPILDANGIAVAALSISGPRARFNPKDADTVVDDLARAAAAVSSQLNPIPDSECERAAQSPATALSAGS